jgi:hypothetical protein
MPWLLVRLLRTLGDAVPALEITKTLRAQFSSSCGASRGPRTMCAASSQGPTLGHEVHGGRPMPLAKSGELALTAGVIGCG